ncbi:MAG: hypothetical protein AB1445_15775 [Bacillota bacterium]
MSLRAALCTRGLSVTGPRGRGPDVEEQAPDEKGCRKPATRSQVE